MSSVTDKKDFNNTIVVSRGCVDFSAAFSNAVLCAVCGRYRLLPDYHQQLSTHSHVHVHPSNLVVTVSCVSRSLHAPKCTHIRPISCFNCLNLTCLPSLTGCGEDYEFGTHVGANASINAIFGDVTPAYNKTVVFK